MESKQTPKPPSTARPSQTVRPQPVPLRQRLRAYGSMMRRDPAYRGGVAAMGVNQLGDGLVTGGVLLLMSTLAAVNPPLAIVGLAVFTLVEIAVAAVSFLVASHRRDHEENLRRAGFTVSPQDNDNAQRLERSGHIDAAAAALLVLGVVGAAFAAFGAAAVFVVVVGVKTVQAYNKSYENGAWSCLKYNLGTPETQKQQLSMRSTIGALELGMGGLIYGVGALATFVALYAVGIAFPPALPFVALATVLLGGTLTCGSKVAFGRWVRHAPGGRDPKTRTESLQEQPESPRATSHLDHT